MADTNALSNPKTLSNFVSAIEERNGRFFIALGFSGCNLPANQVRGYATREAAARAHRRCGATKAGFVR